MSEKDWTKDKQGRSNNSAAFKHIVDDLSIVLSQHRLGTPPKDTARLIMARLAHLYGMAPTRKPQP